MPQVRPNCEWCGCALPVDAPGEVICIFGCTFCDACVRQVLQRNRDSA
ncbi:DUF1272 domain-containing protein [Luteimonas sp. WGS1318]